MKVMFLKEILTDKSCQLVFALSTIFVSSGSSLPLSFAVLQEENGAYFYFNLFFPVRSLDVES